MTDFRALCADLLRELDHASSWDYQQALKDQARAALAQPEPEGPTDEDLRELYDEAGVAPEEGPWVRKYTRAVLARWGRPTPQPIPVSERLPGPGDIDDLGRCWWWYPETAGALGYWQWEATAMARAVDEQPVAWLPAHALPVPTRSENV